MRVVTGVASRTRGRACRGLSHTYAYGKLNMASSSGVIDVNELLAPHVLLACLVVMLNPLIWNCIVRLEYNTRLVTRLFGGPRTAVVILAAFIMSMNFFRTSLFRYMATNDTVKLDFLQNAVGLGVGYLTIGVGLLLVATSYWRLGFYNTFLGDYFGILMDAKVTSFPFSVVDDPMYWGGSLIYVGDAICYASPVALLLAMFIGISYAVAAKVEGPFTAKIYAEKAAKSN